MRENNRGLGPYFRGKTLLFMIFYLYYIRIKLFKLNSNLFTCYLIDSEPWLSFLLKRGQS